MSANTSDDVPVRQYLPARISHDVEAYDREDKPWSLCIDTPDGSHRRTAWSAEALVAHALRWARERNCGLTITLWSERTGLEGRHA